MVRIANVNDAEQLYILNVEFNGENEANIESIKESLLNNKQEVVIVASEEDMLVGFVCVQLKKHFAMMTICLRLRKYMSGLNIEKEGWQVK